MEISDNLRRFRTAAGLSQSELASKARVSQQLISQIERGENTTTKYLPRIARALGRSVFEVDPAFRAADIGSTNEQVAELMVIAERLSEHPHLFAHLLEQARKAEALVRDLEEPQVPNRAGDSR